MKCIIAGAGFKGFCDALFLSGISELEVEIVEPAPFFGGIAYSRAVKGFQVDKGVHFFDSVPKELGDIVEEILEGKVNYIDVHSASAFNNTVTDGFSLPDLSSLDDDVCTKIKKELVEISQKAVKNEFDSLYDLFVSKFGQTAGTIYAQIFRNVYSIDAKEIEPSGLSHTSLHRLKFLDDEAMKLLKEDAYLDTVLAARRSTLGKIDDLVTVYPAEGLAMKGWCDAAVTWLEKRGVKIHLGKKIDQIRKRDNGKLALSIEGETVLADRLIWSNENTEALCNALGIENAIKPFQYGTPMMFATLITDASNINDLTYLQNFNTGGLTYRTATAGIYSGQVNAESCSFITSECPTMIGSAAWENPESQVEAIWAECRDLGIVDKNAKLRDHEIIKIPGTFKPPKVGYSDSVQQMEDCIHEQFPNVLFRNPRVFFRREIYQDSKCLPEMMGLA